MERRELPIEELGRIAPDESSGISAVTLSELLVGAYRANTPDRRVRRDAFITSVLAAFPVLPFDATVAQAHAALWAELAERGALIGAHDMLIAATALAHGYAVLTDNLREFSRVPGLEVRQPDW